MNITIESAGVPTAGQQYSLQCTVDASVNNLTLSPLVIWERISDNGEVEVLGDNVTLTMVNNRRTVLTLTFTELLTSDGGLYRCTAALETNEFTITRTAQNTTIIATGMHHSITMQLNR